MEDINDEIKLNTIDIDYCKKKTIQFPQRLCTKQNLQADTST